MIARLPCPPRFRSGCRSTRRMDLVMHRWCSRGVKAAPFAPSFHDTTAACRRLLSARAGPACSNRSCWCTDERTAARRGQAPRLRGRWGRDNVAVVARLLPLPLLTPLRRSGCARTGTAIDVSPHGAGPTHCTLTSPTVPPGDSSPTPKLIRCCHLLLPLGE